MNETLEFLRQNETKVRIGKAVVDSIGYDENYYIPRTIFWPKIRLKSDGRDRKVSVCNKHQEFEKLTENAARLGEII